MNRRSSCRNQPHRASARATLRGLTLLEALVYCAVLVTVLTLGLKTLIVTRNLNLRSEAVTVLSAHAQEVLSQARALPFDSITSQALSQTLMLGGGPGRLQAFSTDVSTSVTLLTPNLKQVSSRVAWDDPKSPVAVTLTTRIARQDRQAPLP